jgi:polysaccharide biosynthesis transport protein
MLQVPRLTSLKSSESIREALPSAEMVHAALDFVRRQRLVIACVTAATFALALLYVLVTPPGYTATASLLIDTQKVHLFQQDSSRNDVPIDTDAVDTQVQIIRSEAIALMVMSQLHLTDDPKFLASGDGLISTLWENLTRSAVSQSPESNTALTLQAVNVFENNLSVSRLNLTYVIQISFLSRTPERDTEIANAVANAYIQDQLDAKYQAARRAGMWLQNRLGELREQASAAEQAVVDFKKKNNIVDAGGISMNEQQLAQLNSDLVVARQPWLVLLRMTSLPNCALNIFNYQLRKQIGPFATETIISPS